jgi:L-alanine-DL-glutamate epimerase-like enolase superfamily enzyme
VSKRDYTILRVAISDGTEGQAYALTRGAPIDLIIADLLAPILLNEDAEPIPRLTERCSRALVALGSQGLVQRAVSLIDIALWDRRARKENVPLFELLGAGSGASVETMLVEGYPRRNEDPRAFADRLREKADGGFRFLKLAHVPDRGKMVSCLRHTRECVPVGTELVVDVAWAWRGVNQGLAEARGWEEYELAWIEDPFPSDEVEAIAEFARAVETPIAIGDEMTTLAAAYRLIDSSALGLLRGDVTAIGGFTGFSKLHEAAERGNLRISPHVHPELHQHCAFAWAAVGPVELMGGSKGEFDCTSAFVDDKALEWHEPGRLAPPKRPGLGIAFDWEAVERHTVRHLRRGLAPNAAS